MAWAFPRSATIPNLLDPDEAAARASRGAFEEGDRRRADARPEERQHLRRSRLDEERGRQLAALPHDLAAAHRLRRRSTTCASASRTARCSSPGTNGPAARIWRRSPAIWRRMFARHSVGEFRPELRSVALRPAVHGAVRRAARVQGQALPSAREGCEDRPGPARTRSASSPIRSSGISRASPATARSTGPHSWRVLMETGYDGPVCIEVEDDTFGKTLEGRKRALRSRAMCWLHSFPVRETQTLVL